MVNRKGTSPTRTELDKAIRDLVDASCRVHEVTARAVGPSSAESHTIMTIRNEARELLMAVLERIAKWLPRSHLPANERRELARRTVEATHALGRNDPRPSVSTLVRVRAALGPNTSGETTKHLHTVVADQNKILALFLPTILGEARDQRE